MQQFYTAESVTEGHPDKLCDLIADTILDTCLARDALARVACEVMATKGHIVVAGEISTIIQLDIPGIAQGVLARVGYDPARFQFHDFTHRQSPDIAAGVDHPIEMRDGTGSESDMHQLGAGDQGVMVGYATDETPEYLPLPIVLAHKLTQTLTAVRKSGEVFGLEPDGKAQVTIEYSDDGRPLRLDSVVVSTQHSPRLDQDAVCRIVTDRVLIPALADLPPDKDTLVLINPSGRFVHGGPAADTGLTGRKLMVDSYGVFAPHGGGAFSGKDASKVDRSGAYMARYIAKNIVSARLASRCQVTLAYAIGRAEPVMVEVETFGTGTACADDCLADAVRKVFKLTPAAIYVTLGLYLPRFARTAVGGHFGRKAYPWERTDQVKALLDAVAE